LIGNCQAGERNLNNGRRKKREDKALDVPIDQFLEERESKKKGGSSCRPKRALQKKKKKTKREAMKGGQPAKKRQAIQKGVLPLEVIKRDAGDGGKGPLEEPSRTTAWTKGQ